MKMKEICGMWNAAEYYNLFPNIRRRDLKKYLDLQKLCIKVKKFQCCLLLNNISKKSYNFLTVPLLVYSFAAKETCAAEIADFAQSDFRLNFSQLYLI